MKLVSLTPIKNEDWCIGLTLRVLMQIVDHAVVLLHSCTDCSAEIVEMVSRENPGRVTALMENDRTWDEMRHRQQMLEEARRLGATHLYLADSDEVLSANLIPSSRDTISRVASGAICELPGYNLRGSLDRYHSNGIWGNRWFSCAFKDQPEAHWAGDKFHSRNPAGVQWRNWRPIKQGEGGILHLWGASERRLRAKHALYKVTERLRWPAKNVKTIESEYTLWRETPPDTDKGDWARWPSTYWSAPGGWTFADVPREWWEHSGLYSQQCFTRGGGLGPDGASAEPWQEAEVRRLVQEHGGEEKFQGLDLFGVA